ncbi:MAG TPA: ribosome silencing factor [Thermoanaerobaculaceae bacterium]|nr:ribosome silencing factor [Thermoanaerobaculaceae bacterium]HRS15519.1 ribosome silencing factor [Thermoanaerobaculaceae bacterium]
MEPDVLMRLRPAVAALEDKKAFHLVALDVSKQTSIADAFVICSVGSQRHAQAVADEVAQVLRERGTRPLAVEGYPQGTWILMDFGDFIVHVMQEDRREYYALERLWGDAPDITSELLAGTS